MPWKWEHVKQLQLKRCNIIISSQLPVISRRVVFSATVSILSHCAGSFCVIKSPTIRLNIQPVCCLQFPCIISSISSGFISSISDTLEALCSRQLMKWHCWLPGSAGGAVHLKEAASISTRTRRLTMGRAEKEDLTLRCPFILTKERGHL